MKGHFRYTRGESFTYGVTRKSFHYVGEISFVQAFLVIAKTAMAVFRMENGIFSLSEA